MDTKPREYIPFIELPADEKIHAAEAVGEGGTFIRADGSCYRFWQYGAGGEPWYNLEAKAPSRAPMVKEIYLQGVELTPEELFEWSEHGVFVRDGKPFEFWKSGADKTPWFKLITEAVVASTATSDGGPDDAR